MSFTSYVFLSIALSLTPQQAARDLMAVPAGQPIHIDGVLEDKEWSDAGVWKLAGTGQLLMKHDSDFLYLGLRGPGSGWAHVYLAGGDRVVALHASAALGTAEYVLSGNEVYQPVREFAWTVRDTSQSVAARLARTEFLEANGWVASTVWMGAPAELEFILARDYFEGGTPTVAVVFATGQGAYHYWPETLAGDALAEDLIEGNTPADLWFRTEGWATLDLGGAGLEVETGYVDVEGARLYYEQAGQGDPLVLIHGGFLDRRMWDGQFEFFARRNRVIRYDVRAHGLSRTDSMEYADHEDLRDLMAALDVPRATLVGLSMGGQIAIDFALSFPEMTEALVLVGPGMSGYPFDNEQLEAYLNELTAAFESGGFPAAFEVFTRYWCDGPEREPSQVDPAVREKVLMMLAGSEERWRYWDLGRQLDPPAIGRLAEIDVPTLALVGSIDMSDIHSIVDLIAEQVPGARKAVIRDVAHMVNMEKPDEFNRLVLEFLSRL
jgi:pimeloyl-ACP methyl ester carboxylesterase